MSIKLNGKFGFTLIELLITIAIIVIISTFIVSGMGSYLARGRDQARKQKLAQLQQALTLYHNDNSWYPCGQNSTTFVGFLSGANCGLTSSYIKELPHDQRAPLNGCNVQFSDYAYKVGADSQTYQLYAKLENLHDPAVSGPYTIDVGGTSCTYNYRVENP